MEILFKNFIPKLFFILIYNRKSYVSITLSQYFPQRGIIKITITIDKNNYNYFL